MLTAILKHMNSKQITPGTLVQIEGVKASVMVVSVDGDNVTVSGPRGEFLLTDCGSHWVRWPLANGPFARSAAPRECRILSAIVPVAL